jgi:uncharacterized damage-inducible protein DinB
MEQFRLICKLTDVKHRVFLSKVQLNIRRNNMPTPSQYIDRIKRVNDGIKQKTEALTHADSMKQLPFPANCMNWNIGHIVVYRDEYLGAIDGVSSASPTEFAVYGAGSAPLTDDSKAIQLGSLLEKLEDSSARLKVALQTLSPDKLNEPYESHAGNTLDDYLQFYIIVHEAYHLGQLEILRELAVA